MSEIKGRDGVLIYNTNTLNLKVYNLTEEQVKTAISVALKEIHEKHDIKSSFHLNYVRRCDRETKRLVSTGISFVFFTNPEVYHILLGRNPDGTDRVETKLQPGWEPPVEEEEICFDPSQGWGDMMAELDERKEKYIHPVIRTTLEPLVGPLVGIDDQGDEIEISSQAAFVKITPRTSHRDMSILRTRLSLKICPKMFENFMKQFSHTAGYPQISFKSLDESTNDVYIQFDPRTYDAMFCHQMVQTMQMKGKDGEMYVVRFEFHEPKGPKGPKGSNRPRRGGWTKKAQLNKR